MNQRFGPEDPQRFAAAVECFDAANSGDPNREWDADEQHPRELLYARWLTTWVLKLSPTASEPLRLAARAAHLRRWEIARTSYPATRGGYLRWRADLKKFHGKEASVLLSQVGYSEQTIRRVQTLIEKSGFPEDPESRILEDALCLVFLEHQFSDLARKSTEDKVINALQKTWQKMTPAAHAIALKLHYEPFEATLLERALRPVTSLEDQKTK